MTTPPGEWNIVMIAKILGTTGVSVGRYLSGERYPEVNMIKKLEILLGWKAQDQVDLIPLTGSDLAYSMKLRKELEEWKIQNPRTVPAARLVSRFPSRYADPFGREAGKNP
jgi:hypothetical protein